MRIHNAVAGTLARELRATGGHVDVERAMPAMSVVRADGTIEEAIMDVTVWWPGALEWYGIDATVRFAGASRYVGAQRRAGAAAAQAEKEKVRRYGRDVLPLAYEAGGRLGPGSESTLQRLADAAVTSTSGLLSRRGILAQWRRRLEASLLFASADAVLCATGRGAKGAQFAARWCATRPVPAPIADAVDCQPARPNRGVLVQNCQNRQPARPNRGVSPPFVSPPIDCPDESVRGLELEKECLQEGLEALIAEDEEAAWYLHAGGT